MFLQCYGTSKGGKICANFGTLQRLIKSVKPKKSLKNWQEKQEKVGKIISMDFTAGLKSCSTKTKFDNLFKTNRKVAQDSWAWFATYWGILSFKFKKLFVNYYALSKVFVEWLPTTAVGLKKRLFLNTSLSGPPYCAIADHLQFPVLQPATRRPRWLR